MKLIRYSDSTAYNNDWDSFFADPFRAFAPLLRQNSSSAHRPAGVPVEWYEDDDNYYARVELPGVKKENLRLDAEEGLVRLAYERVNGVEDSENDSVRMEKFEQMLRSPEGVENAKIEAILTDGILQLVLPKPAQKKPVSIAVK